MSDQPRTSSDSIVLLSRYNPSPIRRVTWISIETYLKVPHISTKEPLFHPHNVKNYYFDEEYSIKLINLLVYQLAPYYSHKEALSDKQYRLRAKTSVSLVWSTVSNGVKRIPLSSLTSGLALSTARKSGYPTR